MDDLSATPSPDGPERLLQRYLDGDDDAFGALVARYESSLYAYIVRMVGDAHAAEDVFQQTCIKVAKGAAGFDGRASFSTWLFRIARNAALDELRRQAARKGVAAGGMDDIVAAVSDDHTPLDNLTNEELGERIRQALQEIPEVQREAFLLKEEGGLDFEEVGAVLGCGRETAKSRFRLAVGKLRTLLALDSPAHKKVANE